MSEKKAPILRFKGFTDDWEQRKLGELSDITKLAGFEFTKYVTYLDKGNVIALRGLNVKNGTLILKDVKYIDNSDFSKLSRSKLFINDILFTYVGTIGELALVPENNKFYLAPNVARIRVDDELSPHFASHYMRNQTFFDRVIYPLIATSSQPALSMENIRKFELKIPNIKEQNEIGTLLQALDRTIALHQRKLEKLKSLKKVFLQQMFPQADKKIPKLRFSSFNMDWEYRELREIAETFTGGGTPKTVETNYWNGEIPWIQSSDISEHDVLKVSIRKYITKEGLDNSAAKLISKNSIALITRVGVGKLCIIPFDYSTSQDLLSLSELKIDKWFAVYSLYNMLQKQLSSVQGTSIKGITKNELLSKKIKIPIEEKEQIQIGKLFKQLDKTIVLHQNKLEKLKILKKVYLQKMFI